LTGTHQVGPDSGTLQIKTGREGAAGKMGHDLTLSVGSWSGTVDLDNGSVELTADPGSIEVVQGTGGAKPLTDKDKKDIKKSISGKVLGSSQITFKSSSVEDNGGQLNVSGDLSIAGKSSQVSVPLSVNGTKVSGSTTLSQSDFGIKQFSALMGALKVKDQVTVEIEADLS
jgi:polyisoprenoid-binding protein YceI